jgi:mycothiol synthase
MIRVRAADSDADLNAWIHVRRVVEPGESAGTVELLRAREKPERLLLLADLKGELAGSGICDRSDLGDRFFVAPRVLPAARRRGVGTALLHALVEHAAAFAVDKLSADVTDDASRSFAERFGFRETDRQLEQVRWLGEPPPPSTVPDGLEIVTIAERPDSSRPPTRLPVRAIQTWPRSGRRRSHWATGSATKRRCARAPSWRSWTGRWRVIPG